MIASVNGHLVVHIRPGSFQQFFRERLIPNNLTPVNLEVPGEDQVYSSRCFLLHLSLYAYASGSESRIISVRIPRTGLVPGALGLLYGEPRVNVTRLEERIRFCEMEYVCIPQNIAAPEAIDELERPVESNWEAAASCGVLSCVSRSR
jgi:hypothetical protein